MNKAQIIGTLTDEFVFSHEVMNERFFTAHVETERISGARDIVPIMASEYVADLEAFKAGQLIEIDGECRTHNDQQKRLHIFVFASRIAHSTEGHMDKVEIEGYICKKPVIRETPFGREIADLIIAVERRFGKSDYIPCIVWGRNARKAYMYDVGHRVALAGRFQSRHYNKATESGIIEKTAFEISAESISVC